MSDTVIDFEQVKINNLKLKKCTHISNDYYVLPIKYRERDVDKNFILQTPLLYSLQGLIEYNNYCGKKKFFIDFSLLDQNINNKIKAFKKFIERIEKFTIKKSQVFGKKLKKNINVNSLQSCLKTNNNDELIRFKINSNKNKVDIGIFNDSKESVDFSYITQDMRAVSIIEIPEIWYYKGNFGYTINILQIRIENKKKLTNYAFIDTINNDDDKDNNNTTPIKDDPRFTKYFKMLKMRIPINSIKEKMSLENIDPNIIDLDPNKPFIEDEKDIIPIKDDTRFMKYFKMLKMRVPINCIKEKMSLENIDPNIIDLDPDKPYNEDDKNIKSNNTSLINNNILLQGLNSLKKTEIDKKEEFKKKLKPLSNGFEPPTSDILLSIRNNLKPPQK